MFYSSKIFHFESFLQFQLDINKNCTYKGFFRIEERVSEVYKKLQIRSFLHTQLVCIKTPVELGHHQIVG